jgi:hypothetical protein
MDFSPLQSIKLVELGVVYSVWDKATTNHLTTFMSRISSSDVVFERLSGRLLGERALISPIFSNG